MVLLSANGRTTQPSRVSGNNVFSTVVMPVICWYTGIQPPSFHIVFIEGSFFVSRYKLVGINILTNCQVCLIINSGRIRKNKMNSNHLLLLVREWRSLCTTLESRNQLAESYEDRYIRHTTNWMNTTSV